MVFDSEKIENEYYDTKYIRKKYGQPFAVKLTKMLGFIDCAECAYDVKNMPIYRMHLLSGDLEGVYSLSPDNYRTKWRVPVICLDNNDTPWKPDSTHLEIDVLKETKKFNVKEIVDYHD